MATGDPVNNRLLRTPEPSPGDVLLIGREASVQFADDRGNATERREIFVQRHGLYRLHKRTAT
ncbi:hypothetical protein EDC02_6452 [Micromonospora sp. Llam0]|uniref:hypothetical protein n=1 Tax=Micromonospora sp. Llam0 TaxID=2485143 RepID=UPI000F496768|nr:hypothetical protein [Micromonospora sp. Llam0]ROO51572.1 hypothetical protein EDC02_6452 [Micromonospora sp. Llam0]